MVGEANTLVDLPLSHVKGTAYRLIPSQFPPIDIFEDLLDPEELELAFELESMTNDRIGEQVGDIRLVPMDQRVVGPGTTPIMAAFTHAGVPSRFTDGRYGVYYAGLSLETAIDESMHSRARFLKNSHTPATRVTMRCYTCKVDTDLTDVRNEEAYHQEDWGPAQSLGADVRKQGSNGIIYRSVRHTGGENIAMFKPNSLVPPANQAGHYEYIWDGSKITDVIKLTTVNIGN